MKTDSQISEAELWRQADACLDQLLDIAPALRATTLASMNLSDELRARVHQLLSADAEHFGPLERDLALPDATPSPLLGRQLGCWTLMEEVGRGGMAVVFRGESSAQGIKRQAAIKLLTLGALDAHGLERFRQEQKILARLNHPHIASLIDSGRAEDGTPWLAMPFVEGLRIDHWCAQKHIDLAGRMQLFLEVCRTVAYAHANLIIHRDLKPSNVLVDGDGHVRLLDFGIARQTDIDLEAPTLTQWRALSPQYAAPEQFVGAPAAITMDVYGLGALLYHLLVGRPPRRQHDSPHTQPTAPSRAIPDTPSPSSLRGNPLRGDLDAITLRCLEIDPAQRYASVGELIDDVSRWQTRRVVRARRGGAGYRMQRFALRYWRGLAVAGLALALILLGTGLSLWQAGIAARQALRAEQQRLRAEQALGFVEDLLLNADRSVPRGQLPSTERLLTRGAENIGSAFVDDPEGEARILSLIGRILVRAERFDQGLPMLTRAFELRRDNLGTRDARVVDAALNLADAELASNGVVSDSLRQRLHQLLDERLLLPQQLPLPGMGSDAGRLLAALANLADRSNDFDQSIEQYDRAIEWLRSDSATAPEALAAALAGRGSLLAKVNQTEAGLADLDENLRLLRARYGAQHWNTIEALRLLGIAQFHANQPTARETLQLALSSSESITREPNLLWADLAGWYAAWMAAYDGRPDLAIPIYQKVVAVRTELLGVTHAETLRARGDLGTVARAAGALTLAAESLDGVLDELAKQDKSESVNFGILLRTKANLQLDRGELLQAEQLITQARAVLSKSIPTAEAFITAPISGQILLGQGKTEQACKEFERGMQAAKNLPDTDQNRLGIEQLSGDCWRRLGRWDDARTLLDDVAQRAQRGLSAGHPRLGALALARAELAWARGEREAARSLLRDAKAILDPWPGTSPTQRAELRAFEQR